jgi:hypothetical protein
LEAPELEPIYPTQPELKQSVPPAGKIFVIPAEPLLGQVHFIGRRNPPATSYWTRMT